MSTRNRTCVLGAFDTLSDRRDFLAAQWFWSHDYTRHSAHIPPGRGGLVKASPPDRRYENALTVADGDYVTLRGRLSTTRPHAAGPEADPR